VTAPSSGIVPSRLARLVAGLLGFVLVLAPSAAFAAVEPASSAPVADEAHIIDSKTEKLLNEKLEEYRAEHGIRIVVLTVDSTAGKTVEQYAYDSAFGRDVDVFDGGVLIVVDSKSKTAFVQVGMSLCSPRRYCELPTDRVSRATDLMNQMLREDKPSAAVTAGVDDIISTLNGHPIDWAGLRPWIIVGGIVMLFIILTSIGVGKGDRNYGVFTDDKGRAYDVYGGGKAGGGYGGFGGFFSGRSSNRR
jgi:uncharacterized protein